MVLPQTEHAGEGQLDLKPFFQYQKEKTVMSRILTSLAVLCLCISSLSVTRSANLAASNFDWPQWRGPQRNGVSQETGLLKQWPAQGPKLLWQMNDIGDGYSTPAVVGSRLYLMSNRGFDNEFVQALSIQDGKPIWTTRIGNVGNPKDFLYAKARSTPTVDGEFIYALGSDGDLACLETKSGKIRWQQNLRKEFGGKPGAWAYAESPLIDGDVVVVTPGGEAATIVALNKKTGAVIWKSSIPAGTEHADYASAIVVQAGGRKQYVQFLSKGIVGVDATTGELLWCYKEVAKGMAQMWTPVARDGYVYGGAAGIGGGLVRLKPENGGVAAEQVYFARGLPHSIGGAVLVGDHLYGTSSQGMVAVEFTTGKVKWQGEGIGSGSVVYADGQLYLHGENGDVALIDATPDAYREKGRFTPPAQPKRKRLGPMPEKAWTYPVIANGRLYIRDNETLWAYDIKAGR
jgi:outer membrane protein assembly factor BamB